MAIEGIPGKAIGLDNPQALARVQARAQRAAREASATSLSDSEAGQLPSIQPAVEYVPAEAPLTASAVANPSPAATPASPAPAAPAAGPSPTASLTLSEALARTQETLARVNQKLANGAFDTQPERAPGQSSEIEQLKPPLDLMMAQLEGQALLGAQLLNGVPAGDPNSAMLSQGLINTILSNKATPELLQRLLGQVDTRA